MHQPVTGPLATLGTSARSGAMVAWEEINAKGGILGKKVDLLVEDVGADNTSAQNSFNKILSDRPLAVVGTLASTQMFALTPTIKQERIAVLFASTNSEVTRQGGGYLFRLIHHDEESIKLRVRFVKDELQKTKLASIHVNDEYGNGAHKVIVDEAQRLGGMTVTTDESVSTQDKDVSAQLIKAKSSGAEIILINAFPAQSSLMVKQWKQYASGVDLLGDGGIASPAVLNVVTDQEADGAISATSGDPAVVDSPELKAFTVKYQEKMRGVNPDAYGTNFYDGVYMLAKAIEDSRGESREAVVEAMKKQTRTGLLYELKANQYGDFVPWTVFVRLVGKKTELIKALRFEG